jgi:hypothetical protein
LKILESSLIQINHDKICFFSNHEPTLISALIFIKGNIDRYIFGNEIQKKISIKTKFFKKKNELFLNIIKNIGIIPKKTANNPSILLKVGYRNMHKIIR